MTSLRLRQQFQCSGKKGRRATAKNTSCTYNCAAYRPLFSFNRLPLLLLLVRWVLLLPMLFLNLIYNAYLLRMALNHFPGTTVQQLYCIGLENFFDPQGIGGGGGWLAQV